jgi:integral membrane protein (TIGR01906 family)
MEDVKKLFKYAIYFVIFFSISIFLLIRKIDLPYIFLYSLIPIIILIFLVYFLSFDLSFTYFHKIFFKNDLWLLDPSKDRLIVLMPIEFFIRSFARIIYFSIFSLLILFTLFFILEGSFERKSL